MGISETDLAFIVALGELPKRVCDLGDQDLHCYNEVAFDRLCLDAPRRGKARDFWKALGADYLSLDIVGDATRFDLNIDQPKPEWGKFDLVTNCGDTEHVLNQLNCFVVMHDLARVGGVLYHALPIAGYSGHGFFNYNAKFFAALAQSNGYEIVKHSIDVSDKSMYLSPDPRMSGYDASIRVALRKVIDAPFKIPIDLTGSELDLPRLPFSESRASWMRRYISYLLRRAHLVP